MFKKANWFKVEFYDKNSFKERYRTLKIYVSKYGNVRETLRAKLKALGFSNIEILQYYIVSSNYLR